MEDSISSIGYWWLPDSPAKVIVGKLDFTVKTGGLLELFGNLNEGDGMDAFTKLVESEHEEFKLINGYMDGKEITLLQCVHLGGTLNKMTIRVSKVILGNQFTTLEDVNFNSVEVGLTHLDYWHRNNILHFDLNDKKIQTIDKEPLMLYEDNELSIELKIYPNYKIENMIGDREINVKQNTLLSITFKEKSWYIDDVLDLLYKIENFFVIALGMPVYPTYIRGYNDKTYHEYPDNKIHHIGMEIYYRIGLYYPVAKNGNFEVIFSYNDWSAKIRDVFNSLFEKENLLRPVYNLFLYLYIIIQTCINKTHL